MHSSVSLTYSQLGITFKLLSKLSNKRKVQLLSDHLKCLNALRKNVKLELP